jgi:hypothetical protein
MCNVIHVIISQEQSPMDSCRNAPLTWSLIHQLGHCYNPEQLSMYNWTQEHLVYKLKVHILKICSESHHQGGTGIRGGTGCAWSYVSRFNSLFLQT